MFRSILTLALCALPLLAADTKPPTIPGNLSASSITSSSVVLKWKASSDFKNGSGVAAYELFRNGVQFASTTALTYQVTGLSPSTTYSFAVRARDNAGNVSGLSSPVSVTTLAGACSSYPATPANLAVSSVSSTTATLTWSAVAPPAGCSVIYTLYRDGSPVATGITVTSYTATGLSPSTTYNFAIAAVTSFGASPLSNPVPATTTAGGTPTSGWPTRVFAPYTDATLWPPPALTSIATQTGSKYFTLGFIVSGSACQATWGTYYTMSQNFLGSEIVNLRAVGGDVIASFGGAANQELALTCSSVSALQAQYQAVIDTYSLTRIDFDIEGAALSDSTSIDRRNKAIAALQSAAAAANRALHVQYTLPVMPTGLTQSGLNLLQNAINNGVRIDTVNIMAMNYGASYDPNQMGAHAVAAMTATINQLKTLYGATRTDAQVRALLGVTPMIGLNDVSPEVFTLADASTLLTAAQQNGIHLLSFWSTARDQQCPGAPVLSSTCSGVTQSPWAFTNIFQVFTGN